MDSLTVRRHNRLDERTAGHIVWWPCRNRLGEPLVFTYLEEKIPADRIFCHLD